MRITKKTHQLSSRPSNGQDHQFLRFNDLRKENERLKTIQLKANSFNSSNSVIQLYRTENEMYQISQNDEYLVHKNIRDRLWVNNKKNGKPPQPKEHFEEVENTGDYTVYMAKARFPEKPFYNYEGENLCSNYAAALITNSKKWKNMNGKVHANKDHVDRSGTKDGEDPDFNYIIADPELNLKNKGEHAQPNIQEAYFTWPNPKAKTKATGCNHHMATVVAKDGGDRITAEANVSNQNLKKPEFFMYGTEQKEQSFQHFHKSKYASGETKDTNDPDNRVSVLSRMPNMFDPILEAFK
ncbi:MAG: hypothetical protein CL840_08470 [Crocinitomicaceae bacterium]|nr:hypothetical protein [Crocinitomicaceae bacterium]|tara:strand:- start:35540 stop:36430 length:891 start_codon:yes stop_codon:yes gene_type:complete